jgi:hypothetical protein
VDRLKSTLVTKADNRGDTSMTSKQREWLIGLRDFPGFDRTFVPHAATEMSCERRGWATYDYVIGTKMAWHITPAERRALRDQQPALIEPEF